MWDKYVKRGRPYLEIETHSLDEAREGLTRGVLIMVLPGERSGGAREQGGPGAREQGSRGARENSPQHHSPLGPLSRTVTQETINRYAAASGDTNPIHTDEAYARQAGLGGTIAQGFLILAYVSTMMTRFLGRGWVEGGHLSVAFVAPVHPGDTVTAHGIADQPQQAGRGKVLADIWVENQRGAKVLVGTAGGWRHKGWGETLPHPSV